MAVVKKLKNVTRVHPKGSNNKGKEHNVVNL